jgi:hypothetical protein
MAARRRFAGLIICGTVAAVSLIGTPAVAAPLTLAAPGRCRVRPGPDLLLSEPGLGGTGH